MLTNLSPIITMLITNSLLEKPPLISNSLLEKLPLIPNSLTKKKKTMYHRQIFLSFLSFENASIVMTIEHFKFSFLLESIAVFSI